MRRRGWIIANVASRCASNDGGSAPTDERQLAAAARLLAGVVAGAVLAVAPLALGPGRRGCWPRARPAGRRRRRSAWGSARPAPSRPPARVLASAAPRAADTDPRDGAPPRKPMTIYSLVIDLAVADGGRNQPT